MVRMLYTPYHILFGVVLSIVLEYFGILNGLKEAVIFVIGNFILDFDHIITILVMRREPYNTARKLLFGFKLKEFGRFLIEKHKDFNNLLLHNYLTFSIVSLLYFALNYFPLRIFLLGIITHSVIDHFDDLYVVGHLKNWFWFINPSRSMKFMIMVSIIVISLGYYLLIFA